MSREAVIRQMRSLQQEYGSVLVKRRPHESRTPEVDVLACLKYNKHLREIRERMGNLAGPTAVNERIFWLLPRDVRTDLAWFKAYDEYYDSYVPSKRKTYLVTYFLLLEDCILQAFRSAGFEPYEYMIIRLASQWVNDLEQLFNDVLSAVETTYASLES